MAEALAMLHWKVRTNAADVEFALGAPRSQYTDADTLDQHAVWLLDFDCCRPISADESGLESIARAFWRNDPYFPQPGSSRTEDQELWDIFAAEYRRIGEEVVRAAPGDGEDVEELCQLVHGAITMIEETKGKWKNGGYF
ncbi:zinc finger protein-domain-containing protein [Stachybotrys elegans]|uniref:Zinc finger protein-domain-containing protein n=1 Tax=Stachybotrys elegans TaxID=80388 RepID=A0A8K0WVJ2_9HYPO|nr:zinc finger protein-domain-containing protein [Stachybotrys elegans]